MYEKKKPTVVHVAFSASRKQPGSYWRSRDIYSEAVGSFCEFMVLKAAHAALQHVQLPADEITMKLHCAVMPLLSINFNSGLFVLC